MAKTTLEDVSLTDTIKHIKTFISPKLAKKLTFEDAESLSLLADNIQELLSTTLSKLVPNAIKNGKYNNTPMYKQGPVYGSNHPSNTQVGIASISEQPQLTVAGDLGTGFSAGGISLFDVTDEVNNNLVNKKIIETIQAQNPGAIVEEKSIEDELGRLNDIFASVEDVQQE